MNDILWWDKLKEGEEYFFSFLFIDRVGSTKDPDYYPQKEVEERASLFRNIVEENVASYNGICIEWHGDATVAFFYTETPDSLLERAYILSKKVVESALAIHGELVMHEELKAYIAIHIGLLPFKKNLGEIKNHELDIGGHILKSCPDASIILHEDVHRVLPDDLKEKFKYYGTTKRDGVPIFVYPRQRGLTEKNKDEFVLPEKDTHNAKEKYLDFIRNRYGKIIPKGLRQEKLISIDLFKIFSPLKVRQRAERDIINEPIFEKEASSPDAQKPYPHFRMETTSPPITIPEVLQKNRHSVILGSPGAGKSTLFKYLALSCAEGRMGIKDRLGLDEALFPILVSIGHLTQIWLANNKTIGICDAIIQYYKILGPDVSSFIKEEIERGKALILFDGMDEVPSDIDRREISRWLEAFIQTYPENRFVITSRIVGFPGISIGQGNIYLIENLTIDDAKPLVEKLMVAIEQGQRGENKTAERIGKNEAKKLIEVLESTPQLAQFIGNPFLLTLTVLIHKIEARLPNYRIQLFERMLQTLVETWHHARSISISQPEFFKMDFRTEAIPILAPLSLLMHEKFPAGILSEDDLKNFIKGKLKERGVSEKEIDKPTEEFLKKLKQGSGLLEEKGSGFWGFTHLSFEEYLSAVELVRNELYNEYLDKFRYSARWEEVFILVASELGITQASTKKVSDYIRNILNGRGDEIHEEILKRHILLAGRCITNTANTDIKLMDEITSHLIKFLFSDIEGLRKRSAKVLSEMLHIQKVMEKVKDKVLANLKNEKKPLLQLFSISAIGELGIKEEWAINAIKDGLREKDTWKQGFATSAIGKLGIRDNWVIEEIENGLKNPLRRLPAIFNIGRLGIKDEWAIDAIKRALRDKDRMGQVIAMLAVEGLNIRDAWVIEIIKDRLKDPFELWSVIMTIGELGIKDDWAIEAIKDGIRDGIRDKNLWVRGSVIFAIGELGIKNDWAIEAIKNGLSHEDTRELGFSISAIGKLGIKDKWAIEAIKNGIRDKDLIVRRSSIFVIGILGIKDEWAIDAIMKGIKDLELKNEAYEALWSLT